MSRLQSGAGGSGGGSGKRRMGGGKIMGTGASEYKSAACLPQVWMTMYLIFELYFKIFKTLPV